MRRFPVSGLIAGGLAMLGAMAVSAAPSPAASAPVGNRPTARPLSPRRTVTRVVVPATEVLRIADRVAQSLATRRRIPAGQTVELSDGSSATLSPAQQFVLLTRFLGNGQEKGITPEFAPAPPEMTGPLDSSPPTVGVSKLAVVKTTDLLAQARATADVAEATGNLPTAVWISGLRFTPAQYMGALATVLQYASMHNAVPQEVAVGNYLPPLDWAAPYAASRQPPVRTHYGSAPESEGTPLADAPDGAEPQISLSPGGTTETPSQPPAASAPPPPPKLSVYVPKKPPLSGALLITVEYEGPAAFIRLSVDGRPRAVSNMQHFTYVWDTRLEPDGRHTLRVAAVNNAEQTLDNVEAKLETANGNRPLR